MHDINTGKKEFSYGTVFHICTSSSLFFLDIITYITRKYTTV